MKKIVIIAAIVGILGGGAGAIVYLRTHPDKPNSTLSSANPPPLPVKLLTWVDPAGFTFQYPDGLSVNKHNEDQDNYAHVELTKLGETGSVIVWAKDPPTLSTGDTATDAPGWIKSDKTLAGLASIDTILGNQPAKKVLLADQHKTFVGTISDSTLWIVEINTGNGDYWQKTADTIAGSFAFTPSSSSASSSDTGGGSDTVDEEEVIQ